VILDNRAIGTGIFWHCARLFRVLAVLAASGVVGVAERVQAEDDVYQKPSEFIREVFEGELPGAGALSLTVDDLTIIKRLMGRSYDGRRVRYWANQERSVWILSDIGKTKPITAGFALKDGKIERARVLVYRESHGFEVKEKFFTKQFQKAGLNEGHQLDKPIDNIAGATLSVRAMTRMAKLALYLEGRRLSK